MEIKEFLMLLNRKKQTIFAILLMFVLVTTVLTVFQPFKYEAKSRVLLLQHNGEVTDPYNSARSSQFISSLLAQVVTSNVFFNDVLEAGFNVDGSYFGDNPEERLREWKKTAEASAINDTGIIEVKTYHTDSSQAEQINSAIINIIQTKNSQYYGRDEDITIKIIDEPIVSNWPVRPNVLVNFILSIVIALLVSFSYVYLFPEAQYDLNFIPRRKKKKNIMDIKHDNITPERIISNNENYPTRSIEAASRNDNNFNNRGDMKNIFDQSDRR